MFFPLKICPLARNGSILKQQFYEKGLRCPCLPDSSQVYQSGQRTNGEKKSSQSSVIWVCGGFPWGNCKMLSAAECKCLCSEHPGLRGGPSAQLNSTAKCSHTELLRRLSHRVWHQFQGTAQPAWALLHAPVSFTPTLRPPLPLLTHQAEVPISASFHHFFTRPSGQHSAVQAAAVPHLPWLKVVSPYRQPQSRLLRFLLSFMKQD